MKILPEIDALVPEMKEWRHHIHAHPETAFEETGTSAFVAEKLRAFGLEVHTGMAKTGVVGVLRGNGGGGNGDAIGLRADLDALHVHERSGVPYASRNEGRMHACGHDGHTTMLLGAAKALAARKSCDGTVYFIFQPAEENEGGGDGRGRSVRQVSDARGVRYVQLAAQAAGLVAMRVAANGRHDIFEIVVTGKAHAPCLTRAGSVSLSRMSSAHCKRSRAICTRSTSAWPASPGAWGDTGT
jgi:hippurate hydrolase